jgi:hypothetical protein
MLSTTSSLCFALLSAAPGSAAEARGFPFDVLRADFERAELTLQARHEELAALAELAAVRLTGVVLPDGRAVELELERVDLSRLESAIHVDGAPWRDALAHVGLTVWIGELAGAPGSEVALSFSQFGSRGWIKADGEAFHLMPFPDADGDWAGGGARFASELTLLGEGLEPRNLCASEQLGEQLLGELGASGIRPTQAQGGKIAQSVDLLELPLAIDCDYQLFQLFGNASAEMAYVTTLLSWVSARYEEQISTVFSYPYLNFWTTSSDPWVAPDDPFSYNCVDLLYEVQEAWQFNVPGGGLIGHVISGASLGCGVAWLPGVCNDPYNFSVSTAMDGLTQFPVQQQPDNWDFMVVAHELGHNLNAPHTHAYCPPLDECAPAGYFEGCQTQQVCTSEGTIMSYCHLCDGGFTNITTYFHDQSALDMRAWAEQNCLPLACAAPATYCTAKVNSQGCLPAMDVSGSATLSGLDDLHLTASNVLNNKSGLLFWGFAPTSVPFQGGTKCVAPPTKRTPLQDSGGDPPPDDCTGSYDFHFSASYMQSKGLTAGTTVYAQYWSRDPSSPSTTGLTDAVSFTICN